MMLLSPKKCKFTKNFSNKKIMSSVGAASCYNKYGNVVLIASESGKITNFQLESLRRFLRRFLKKKAQIFFRIFPNVPITKKPNDVRLGRGKGNVKYWSSFVKKGSPVVEIRSYNDFLTIPVLKMSLLKLSTKTFTFNRQFR
jgi:large subunit ribosomal protein L16